MESPEAIAAEYLRRGTMIDVGSAISRGWALVRDNAGVLIHKYGPHIFHTNSQDVFDYQSQFTAWHQYQHRVLASVDGHARRVEIEPTMKSFREKVTI